MTEEQLEGLIVEATHNIVEIYEPDDWSKKPRIETFAERLDAVEAELRALVRKVLEQR